MGRRLARSGFSGLLLALSLLTASAGASDTLTGSLSDSHAPAALVDEAVRDGISEDPFWRGLLHIPDGKSRSKVITPDFFLSPNGAVDARAELIATLDALLAPVETPPNEHARCRFPARYLWLRSRLHWPKPELPAPPCPDLDRWRHGGNIRAASLVFATGYLRNPASFYGHILLRFISESGSPLLDSSLNYGAIFDPEDHAPQYVIKGLTGRYEGGFTHELFYKRNHKYGELELRDLWEYQLDLSEEELDMLVAHSWELLGRKFHYYFTHDNCATEMAELVELITGRSLHHPHFFWDVPSAIFFRLPGTIVKEGEPSTRITLHPSRQSRLYRRYALLSPGDQQLVRSIASADPNELPGALDRLDTDRTDVLDTLIDFYQIRTLQHPKEARYGEAHQRLLARRISLPAQESTRLRFDAQPPHLGQPATTVRVGPFHHGSLGDGLRVRFRPVFFDVLSLDSALPAYAELALMDVAVDYFRDERSVRLAHLEIFRASTLNVSRTPLHDEEGWAWSFRAAIEPAQLECADCLVPRFVGSLGRAVRASDRTVLYAMGDLQIEESRAGSGSLVIAPRVGTIVTIAPAWKLHLEAGTQHGVDGDRSHETRWRLENRFGIGRSWDLRLLYEYARVSRTSLSLSLYL